MVTRSGSVWAARLPANTTATTLLNSTSNRTQHLHGSDREGEHERDGVLEGSGRAAGGPVGMPQDYRGLFAEPCRTGRGEIGFGAGGRRSGRLTGRRLACIGRVENPREFF